MKTASLKTLAAAAGHLERRANTAECRAEQLRSKLAVEVASGKSRKKMLEEATSAAAATEAHLKSLYAGEHDPGAELKRLQALLEANRISAASMALSSRNLHASSKDYFRLLRVNLEEDLAASRKLVSKLRGELYSAKRKRARPEEEFARRSLARLPGGIRERILAAEEDAATSHALAFKLAQKHKQRLATIKLLQSKLDAALDTVAKQTKSGTDWIDVLGKKGQKYDIFVVEVGLRLMACNMDAAQARYALCVFMLSTHPDLKEGVDYRVPSVSTFKEWGDCLYPIAESVNRTALDTAVAIYYHHDDSPRQGYSWHGSSARAIYKDEDGSSIVRKVPLAISLLEDGCHTTMAEKGVEILGENLCKMCLVMSDAAALDVARHMYTAKKDMVDQIDKAQHTPEQIEVFETEFVAQCINHGGDNASKKNYAAMAAAMKLLVIKYNCATLLQHWFATRVLWRRMNRASNQGSDGDSDSESTQEYCRGDKNRDAPHGLYSDRDSDSEDDDVPIAMQLGLSGPDRATPFTPTVSRFAQFFCMKQAHHGTTDEIWKGILRKVLTGSTGRGLFHCDMELQTSHHGGKEHRVWVITGDVDDVWALMRSMSNLVSNQGSHSKYFLNEAKQMRSKG